MIDISVSSDSVFQWIAQQDGWTVTRKGEYWDGVYYVVDSSRIAGVRQSCCNACLAWLIVNKACPYTTSADAAIGVAERLGFRIDRLGGFGDCWRCEIGEYSGSASVPARAICNALYRAITAKGTEP
jgi:hypothetical protein